MDVDNLIKSINGQASKLKNELIYMIEHAETSEDIKTVFNHLEKLQNNEYLSSITGEIRLLAEQKRNQMPKNPEEEQIIKVQEFCRTGMLNAKSWDELKIITEYMHMFDKSFRKISTPELLQIEQQMNEKLKHTMTSDSLYDENGKMKKFKKIEPQPKKKTDKNEEEVYFELNDIKSKLNLFEEILDVIEKKSRVESKDMDELMYIKQNLSDVTVLLTNLRSNISTDEFNNCNDRIIEAGKRTNSRINLIEQLEDMFNSISL